LYSRKKFYFTNRSVHIKKVSVTLWWPHSHLSVTYHLRWPPKTKISESVNLIFVQNCNFSVKYFPVVNFINILWAAFALIFFCQKKLQSQTVSRKNLVKTLWKEKLNFYFTNNKFNAQLYQFRVTHNFYALHSTLCASKTSINLLAPKLLIDHWWNWQMHVVKISSTFDMQLLCQYSFAKNNSKPNCNERKAKQSTLVQKSKALR